MQSGTLLFLGSGVIFLLNGFLQLSLKGLQERQEHKPGRGRSPRMLRGDHLSLASHIFTHIHTHIFTHIHTFMRTHTHKHSRLLSQFEVQP